MYESFQHTFNILRMHYKIFQHYFIIYNVIFRVLLLIEAFYPIILKQLLEKLFTKFFLQNYSILKTTLLLARFH